MDLPEWPPSYFSGSRGRGDTLPTHADQVTIGDVVNVLENCVRFHCGHENDTVACSFFVPDIEIAQKVATILKAHQGKNLLSIRDVEIPSD
jgi:DNA-binding IscR family transcriptional regulator